ILADDETTAGPEPPSRLPGRSRRRFLRSLVGAGFIATPTLAYARYVEPNDIRVTNLRLEIPGWPRSAAGYRIGHISDFHADSDVEVERAERAAHLLMAQRPDAVFVTGDYF